MNQNVMDTVYGDLDFALVHALYDVAVFAADRIPYGTPEQIVAQNEIYRLRKMKVALVIYCAKCNNVSRVIKGSFGPLRQFQHARQYCQTCLPSQIN